MTDDLEDLRTQIGTLARRLVNDEPHYIRRDNGSIDQTWTPGLLAQLTRAIMADTGRAGRGPGRAPLPISADALDLHTTIARDLGVRPADLAHFLATLPDLARTVRDPDWLGDTANTLQLAITAIEQLLDPPRRLEAVEPCPACGVRTVHRRDSAGEYVRQAALILTPGIGCTCQHCRTHWPPEQLEHLALVLGCQPIS